MEVRVFWIGKTRLPGIQELTEEYTRRLSRYCQFIGEEIRPAKRKSGAPAGADKEESAMLARSSDSYLVVLDACGAQWNSEQFADWLKNREERGTRSITFCVGGSDGFSPEFRKQARLLLSLSPFTMPHELARVVLLEQIYRAWTILAHHPYPR
ncbi:MAG: 23S rRNA (pseudouridine(1915)-N(3))-methyltransferase RlmH [Acidobacteria bacterium]|nr:23S rRNA (pseudouridine(1915)-N(3))-methyltransferase RlmH [Acidobacteriota bacterium]